MKGVVSVCSYVHLRNFIGKTAFDDGYNRTEHVHLVDAEIRERVDNARYAFVSETPNF